MWLGSHVKPGAATSTDTDQVDMDGSKAGEAGIGGACEFMA